MDGLLTSSQVDKDIVNAKNILSEDGSIIIAGINPDQITEPDAWRIIAKFRSENNGKCFSVNLDGGYAIINNYVHSPFTIDLPPMLTWPWFLENKKEVLAMKTYSELVRFYKYEHNLVLPLHKIANTLKKTATP